MVDRAEHRLPLVQEGDQRTEERRGGRERARAIDRIEHPDELGVGALGAEFFAEQAVVGELRLDHAPHQLLGAAVGGGDGREVALEFDGDVVSPEERTDEVAAGAGEFDEESAFGGEVHWKC